ncbi:MIP transporter [Penicillium macrosclerotiorum]|uniref:MIP transporter n=1 Tax=Penicillium macrosclerotiorum TaxID=303699 RepID=UPI0025472DB5|nr:MIP transporter [Penicillium macrosclerotiorum]KAJ5666813.1 MIP transporter [Penicillium macrosclerotiorum]
MDEGGESRRPRAESGPRGPTSPTRSSRGIADEDAISPTRGLSAAEEGQLGEGLRRRSSAARRSGSAGIPSLAPRTTLADRTQGKFTLAGPDETTQMRLSHEPFVQPGYADLNPSYEQANNAKPVWSLAKPLPRVVRPGMVPMKEELLQNRANAQLPAENSQRLGLDVNPNDLEQGKIEKTADPRKMAAMVEDARQQRENNFMNKILNGETTSVRQGSRMSRTSSMRMRRPSAWGGSQDHLSTVDERPSDVTNDDRERPNQYLSDDPLRPVAEEPEGQLGPDMEGKIEFPAIDDATFPEDLHPLIQELVEDEVHNNHTTWSVIRTHHREALAEALAVYVQLTIGFCADLSVTVANAGNPNTTAWAWGLATMIGIYISGGVSGAHLNPAITIMLWFYRGFPKRLMPEYFAAQFVGAFCAALTAYGLYYQSIQMYTSTNAATSIINSFVTSQRETWIDAATAFFTEFLGTCFLTVTVLALGDDQNAPPGAGMSSLIIGLVITCLSMTFAYQTGAAFNPSRDFGPRLALLALGYTNDLFRNPYWFYGPWAGAVSGAFMGGFLYDFMIFTGGESPVNYPLERTQRAMKKSGLKWRRRLGLSKEEPQSIAIA